MKHPQPLLVTTLGPLCAKHAADILPRSNIVFLLTDDQRRDAIRARGTAEIKTPMFEGANSTGSGAPAPQRKRKQE